MTRLLVTLLWCLGASTSLGQTYATALAKMDHVYIGESYAGGASTTLADESGSTDATLVGGDNVEDLETTGPNAWLTTALQLDGASDWFTTAASIGADNVTDFTVFAWVKRDNISSRHSLYGVQGSTLRLARMEANNTEIDVNYNNGLGTVNPGVTTTDWHSYAFVRTDATDSVEVFVDGLSVGTLTTNYGNSVEIDIFGAHDTGTTPLDGAIAQFMTADEALSAAEIAALDAGPSSTAVPIIHYYRQQMDQ